MTAIDLKELQELVAASDLNLEEYKTKSVSELEALLTQLNTKENKLLSWTLKFYEGEIDDLGPFTVAKLKEARQKYTKLVETLKSTISQNAKKEKQKEKKQHRISRDFPLASSLSFETSKFGEIEIPPTEIKLGDVLGKGKYGVVYKGTCFGNKVAVKIPLISDLNQGQLDDFLREIAIMRNSICPYVVLLLGYSVTPDSRHSENTPEIPVRHGKRRGKLMIVTELCVGNTEQLLLNHANQLSLDVRMRMAKEAAMGIAWLHGKKIIHRDLKLENLLYDENKTIKVCDMGFAQIKPPNSNIQAEEGKVRGSAPYIAPEVWSGKPFYEAADVYSFGIIMWEFLTRKRAFLDVIQELDESDDWASHFARRVCLENARPEIPSYCPESLKELIVDCWQLNPAHRPTFREIVTRLDEVIVDAGIADENAAKFWRSHHNTLSEITFDLFWRKFAEFCGYPQSLAQENRSVMAEFFSDRSSKEENVPVVTMLNFGRMIDFFGPLTLPYRPNTGHIFDRLVALFKTQWFHCHMPVQLAQRCLNGSKIGTFLIRFSTTHDDCLVITSVRKGVKPKTNEIVNTRVKFDKRTKRYSLLDGQEFGSLQDLVEKGQNLELAQPWNGHTTFTKENNNPPSSYFIIAQVQEYQPNEIKEVLYDINHFIDANAAEISSGHFDVEEHQQKLAEWTTYLKKQQETINKNMSQLKGKSSGYITEMKELQSEVWSMLDMLHFIVTGEEGENAI